MESEQTLKAKARKGAKSAKRPNETTQKEAIEQTKVTLKKGRKVQPVYKTQEKVAGKNKHRDKGKTVSEFDDPAGNTV